MWEDTGTGGSGPGFPMPHAYPGFPVQAFHGHAIARDIPVAGPSTADDSGVQHGTAAVEEPPPDVAVVRPRANFKTRKGNDSSALKDLLRDTAAEEQSRTPRTPPTPPPRQRVVQTTTTPSEGRKAVTPPVTVQSSSVTLTDEPIPTRQQSKEPTLQKEKQRERERPPQLQCEPQLSSTVDLLSTRLVRLESDRARYEACVQAVAEVGDRILGQGVKDAEPKLERSIEGMVAAWLRTKCPEAAEVFQEKVGMNEIDDDLKLDLMGLREYWLATRFLVSCCLGEAVKESVDRKAAPGVSRAQQLLRKAQLVTKMDRKEVRRGAETFSADDLDGAEDEEEG